MGNGENAAWMAIACRLFCVTCGSVGGLGLVAVGAYLLWNQHYMVATFRATEGRILQWRLEAVSGGNDGYRLAAKYEYQVGGRTYTGDRPFSTPGSWSADGDAVYAVRDQFRSGAKATVYYNAYDPSEAFVLRDDIFRACVFVLLGIAL